MSARSALSALVPRTSVLAASRRYLRRKFGVASDNFCYPSSEYDGATVAAVKEAG
jgi:hypothetical protein